MSSQAAWPVPTAALGSVSVGTMLWRLAGQLNVTVIVKSRFALVANGVMTLLPADPVRTAPLPDSRHPTGDLRGVRETVAQLRVVDVVLYGHGYAPVGPDGARRASHLPLRLRVGRGNDLLIDKTVDLYGDRKGTAEPAAFEKIFLSYARALGGLGFADNPLGRGHGDDAHPPNLVSTTHPTERVGAFGPIPETFPCRRRLLGELPRERLQEEIVDIPVDFDWQYFQNAPVDQRVQSLHGDEWLELQNLTPEHPTLRTALPGGRAVARIYGAERAGVPAQVPLRIELCEIDADAKECSLVWRGSFPVASPELAAELVVAAAWEEPNKPTAWPDTSGQLTRSKGPASTPIDAPTAPDLGGTIRIEAEQAASVTAEPPAVAANTAAKPVADSTQPMTTNQVADALASAQAPFPIAPAGSETSGHRSPSTVPGAPWSNEPVPPLPQAPALGSETMSLDPSAVTDALKRAAAAKSATTGDEPAAETPPPTAAPAEEAAVEGEASPPKPDEAEGTRQEAEAEQARQEAEAARARQQAEMEERTRAAFEAAERAEAERAAAEAEARREAEERARRQAEQEAAELARQNLRQQAQEARKDSAQKLRRGIYGSFSSAKSKGSSGEDR